MRPIFTSRLSFIGLCPPEPVIHPSFPRAVPTQIPHHGHALHPSASVFFPEFVTSCLCSLVGDPSAFSPRPALGGAVSADLTESLPDCRAPLHWCRPDCKALTHYVCRSDWAHRCLTVAIAFAASVSVSVSAAIFIAVAVTVPNAGAATVAGATTVAGAVILTSL